MQKLMSDKCCCARKGNFSTITLAFERECDVTTSWWFSPRKKWFVSSSAAEGDLSARKKWFVWSREAAAAEAAVLSERKKWSLPLCILAACARAGEGERFNERKKWSRSRRISATSPSAPPPMEVASSTERLTTLWSGMG